VQYATVEEAKRAGGLRLVLTRGVPGPWGEAAKAVFRLRDVPFLPVAQSGGGENAALVEWTRHRNAPIAIYNDEAPRVRWLELVELAERLGAGPSLLPDDVHERVTAVGLTNEICGEGGLAWQGRLLMLKAGHDAQGDQVLRTPMYRDYGYTPERAATAIGRVRQVLDLLSARVAAQEQRGSDYLVGDRLSLADVYWGYFSQLIEPLPPEHNPMPEGLRKAWGVVAAALGGYDRALIRQRDRMFQRHLGLPLEF
jgi:glutathione S-transferase